MDQLGHRLTFGPNPLRKLRRTAGAGERGRSDNVSLCAGASRVTAGSESRSGAPLAARERRQRSAEQPLTFAQRAFAAAEVEGSSSRAVELSNLVDLVVKTRGLRRGCGEAHKVLLKAGQTHLAGFTDEQRGLVPDKA
jgi:hypothetical protein